MNTVMNAFMISVRVFAITASIGRAFASRPSLMIHSKLQISWASWHPPFPRMIIYVTFIYSEISFSSGLTNSVCFFQVRSRVRKSMTHTSKLSVIDVAFLPHIFTTNNKIMRLNIAYYASQKHAISEIQKLTDNCVFFFCCPQSGINMSTVNELWKLKQNGSKSTNHKWTGVPWEVRLDDWRQLKTSVTVDLWRVRMTSLVFEMRNTKLHNCLPSFDSKKLALLNTSVDSYIS